MALSDLLQRIKAALGIGSSRGTRQEQPVHQSGRTQRPSDHPAEGGSSVDVTVEREPATESEDAVKGTETATESASETADEPAAEEAESAADAESAATDSDEDEPAADSPSETGAEAEADEPEPEAEADDAGAPADDEASAGSDEPVDVIKGIGPTYADRLGEAGVETVADLAASDLETLAEESGVSEGRLENWIEKAKHR